jgi:hypothetical protein
MPSISISYNFLQMSYPYLFSYPTLDSSPNLGRRLRSYATSGPATIEESSSFFFLPEVRPLLNYIKVPDIVIADSEDVNKEKESSRDDARVAWVQQ